MSVSVSVSRGMLVVVWRCLQTVSETNAIYGVGNDPKRNQVMGLTYLA